MTGPLHRDTVGRGAPAHQEAALTRYRICLRLHLRLPASRTLSNMCQLFTSHPVGGTFAPVAQQDEVLCAWPTLRTPIPLLHRLWVGGFWAEISTEKSMSIMLSGVGQNRRHCQGASTGSAAGTGGVTLSKSPPPPRLWFCAPLWATGGRACLPCSLPASCLLT